jgi:hypothetical protein
MYLLQSSWAWAPVSIIAATMPRAILMIMRIVVDDQASEQPMMQKQAKIHQKQTRYELISTAGTPVLIRD